MKTTVRTDTGPGGGGARGIVRLTAAFLLVNVALMAPVWIRWGQVGPQWVAVEAGLLVAAFGLLPARRWSRILAAGAAAALVGVTLLAVGETAARLALARPLNLYLDIRLLSAVHNLLAGTLGWAGGTAVLSGSVLLLGLLGWGVYRLIVPRPLPRSADSGSGQAAAAESPQGAGRLARRAAPAALLVASAATLLVAMRGPEPGRAGGAEAGIPTRMAAAVNGVLDLPATRIVTDQTRHLFRMLRERERFADEMAASPADYAGRAGLLAGLAGRDVILAFVESYGMSAVEDPRYAPVIRPRLEAFEARAGATGLHLATGRLVAPSQGGQSWFGHGSVLSGLWLDNQLRYDLLLASSRETLVDDFERAGHRTAALMPAITLAWPEGERFGYDEIYDWRRIDYAGPNLNWVTMPDQFTWSFLENTIRPDRDGQPLFAELGLVSSHAPWTPILTVLDDWDSIGDGSVFERWRDAGETPRELWRDHDRVREHYALSLDYALAAMASYAERYVDDSTLLIVLGDHQPAPMITGDGATRAVPVHVVSRDPDLLAPFLSWGFVPGAFPDPQTEPHRMDAFRPWFVEAFSAPEGGT